MALTKFTRSSLESRNTLRDAVIIIDNIVYDVTEFLEEHPGGAEILLDNAGKDASQCFHDVGHSDTAFEWREKFKIGEVVDEDKWEVKPREAYAVQEHDELTLASLLSVWGPPLVMAGISALLYMYLFQ
ncbi:cytochrome b5-like [Manduca sexta]|uniref:Cytochrome b5 heme-binding domain-containing protein n=1 Tax=Manduca sexta TaxID=7130 RepID=A0A921ZN14_MANSE|nr:cytochrome b5 [Manduca sexta]XP_037298626.1 cytochrome b5-like [Manduca sexta]XP_037301356.1 cytochrome b5-like [Manduca sexta]XP_037302224.1 cytochrome b5-like [Manduca sexta]KAG6460905.1 hypothetical protein O3G_MSEX012292 [Manduca sexta]